MVVNPLELGRSVKKSVQCETRVVRGLEEVPIVPLRADGWYGIELHMVQAFT